MRCALRLSRIGLLTIALLLGWTVPRVDASLINGDFLIPGDGFLVTDTVTQLEWLTPFYTRGHTFDDVTVQALIAAHGFRYATATETLDMINNNFGNPPVAFPGTPAGFNAAAAFFGVFGINQHVTCGFPSVPCPRTQGLTSSVGSTPTSHLAFGMIQFGNNGWLIADNPWPDSVADLQVGSWLIRTIAPSAIPEPGSLALLGIGLVGLRAAARRHRL